MQLKRDFFQTKVTGATPQDSLTQLQVDYWRQVGVTGTTFQELEKNWLRKIITDNSGTPTTNFTGELLKQALSALTLTVSQREQENWVTLYKFYVPV